MFQGLKLICCLLGFIILGNDLIAQIPDFKALEFRTVGPYRGGRATAVCGVDLKPNVFYVGTTGGGVWKTDDYGTSWKNISDHFFKTPSIGAIRVAKNNPKLIYVGTGSDGLRSNVIAGKGVYMSADEGKTWTHVGLEKTGQIGAVEIHPNDEKTVFVAAIGQAFQANPERGLYKTIDAGKTWKQVLYISDTTGIVDVEFHPTNPDILYASAWRAERKPWTIISGGAESGIYKSTDGGDTWHKTGKGLPPFMGKIDLSVSPAKPDLLYALVEAPDTLIGLYCSNDQGKTFEHRSNKKEILTRPFYYTNVVADPQNADKVYTLATAYHRSNDGGKTWKKLNAPHGDHHDLWINPKDSNLMVQCNDGGANVSFNGGKTWSHQINQPTAEIYQLEVDNQYPYWLYGGQQDNYTTVAVPSLPPRSHQLGNIAYIMDVGGCETGPAVPHPENPNIVYSNCKGRFSVFNKVSGQEKNYDVEAYYMYGHSPEELPQRFQRVAPIHISPHDPSVIYHCSQYVHKTTTEGKSWERISPDLTAFEADKQVRSGGPITNDITGEEFYSTIYSIQESKLEKGLIWVGANDGPIHLTLDGGKNWTKVTPNMKKGGRVDSVEPSPHQKDKAFATVLRYQLGDWQPYIYRTKDKGKNWKKITKGIPDDYPVRVLREDPNREGLLYAGTEYGLFISFDDGDNWSAFQQNLPITPITDIKIHRGDLILSTMGRGFWILDDISAIWQGLEKTKVTYLFRPQNTIRYRYRRSSTNNPLVSKRIYPAPAAIIDYYLDTKVDNLKLSILDSSGKVIRTFTNENKKADKGKRDMATNTFTNTFTDKLSIEKGFHRFRWDMKHTGAWDKKSSRRYKNGPYAAPGKYTVKLTSPSGDYVQEFQLERDPRISENEVSTGEIKAQEKLALDLIALINKAKRKSAKIEVLMKTTSGQQKETLKEAYDLLVRSKGSYTKPMLISQMTYLYGIINETDQMPGKDAFDRYQQLVTAYEQFNQKYDSLINQL